jgi:hypothetical protein
MSELRHVGAWLARHGLPDSMPTPELAARLRVRTLARLADSVILAVLILAAALVQALRVFDDSGARQRLLVLALLVAGLLVGRWLLDRWVRSVDRRAAAGMVRRATHPAPPGWRDVVGVPYAAFTAGSAAGALALAVSALTVEDPKVRYAAVVLIIGLCGVVGAFAVQIRHLLTRPVVAEDEYSLTADLIMRIEDARQTNVASVLWSLPVVLLFGTAPAWWNVASMALVVGGLVALIAIQARTPTADATARQAMAAR